MANGVCPLGYWDARDLSRPPVVKSEPKGKPQPTDSQRLMELQGVGRGRVLLIVANGPGHREAPLDRLKDHPLIDVLQTNKPDPRLWPPTYWCFVDPSQPKRHKALWRRFKGILFNNSATKTYRPNSIVLRASGAFQLDLRRGAHVGKTSTTVGFQIACWLGYDHVYVFGLDMSRSKSGQLYAWGSNPDVADANREKKFPTENATLDKAGEAMGPENRAKFTICSSYARAAGWSFLKHFEVLDHETAVDEILRRHPSINLPEINSSLPEHPPVVLITCTGDRQAAFNLCERWVGRAIDRYPGKVEWIVSCDGAVPTVCSRGQTRVRREKRPDDPKHTLVPNLLAALRLRDLCGKVVLAPEDDDFFHQDFIVRMVERLRGYDIAGEARARDYHIGARAGLEHANRRHASLVQTAVRGECVPRLLSILNQNRTDVDHQWWAAPGLRKNLWTPGADEPNMVVGIKGMPGRAGITRFHDAKAIGYRADPELSVLRRWIGDDADAYRNFAARLSPA